MTPPPTTQASTPMNFNDPMSPMSPLTPGSPATLMSPRADYQASLSYVTADQQQTYETTPAVMHWSPLVDPPILGFEPSFIQDVFDPFSFLDFSSHNEDLNSNN